VKANASSGEARTPLCCDTPAAFLELGAAAQLYCIPSSGGSRQYRPKSGCQRRSKTEQFSPVQN